ncbi:MAG: tetratricopeptide repeat protein [Acidobacteria bacterium]|nr:MAG: tetratricopeptide repeat protein [Acidobacteriota bacterium]
MALLQQREFSQAEAQFQSLVASFPTVNDLVDRARTYISLCRKQQEEARTLDGFDDFYHHGVYLGNRGDYDEALLYLNKALELEPDSSKVHYSVASVLCLQGERDRALESLRRAVELDESTRIYAKNDPDFQSLHGDPEFNQLLGVAEGQTVG